MTHGSVISYCTCIYTIVLHTENALRQATNQAGCHVCSIFGVAISVGDHFVDDLLVQSSPALASPGKPCDQCYNPNERVDWEPALGVSVYSECLPCGLYLRIVKVVGGDWEISREDHENSEPCGLGFQLARDTNVLHSSRDLRR